MKKLTISILTTLALFIFNSESIFAQGGDGDYYLKTIQVDTFSREYMLYVPDGHDGTAAWPLVINFHGLTGNYLNLITYVRMYEVADTADFLIAYPQGLEIYVPNFGWEIGWHIPCISDAAHDDIQFVREMIDDLVSNSDIAVDTNRIHATGISNGGQMSFYVACELSDRIGSVGGIVGQMPYIMMDSCSPGRQVSVLHLLGTEDPFFPEEGTETLPPLEGAAEYWASTDNCDSIPSVTYLPDIDPNDGSTVTLLDYENCDEDFEVLCYRIEGGGHCWPGGYYPGPCNYDINSSVELWNFFRRNPHPNAYYHCLDDGVTFLSQVQIDNFQTDYPYCKFIGGDVEISGNTIANVDGLSAIESIGGDLVVGYNPLLETIGLENLKTIDGDLQIIANEKLEDLSGLDSLRSIDGDLKIVGNASLSSLSGLDSLAPESIMDLTIAVNENLSFCHIESICYYLYEGPYGSVLIQENDPGCEDSLTIRQSCSPPVGIEAFEVPGLKFEIHPNPFSETTKLKYKLLQPETVTITFYNQYGKQVDMIGQKQLAGKQQVIWMPKNHPPGVYYFRLQAGDQLATGKIVKMSD